ncbi:SurA N-terminal domain-containing protein [Pelagibacterales bacterium SAG-MED19]|nr:SurA N-terminal domain-containing protein [Pelagibacterales bacterium SAG-MED19]
MISSFRNFAKTKFAGLLVFIMIIPFVFWGMGSMFSSGNTNTIAKINKENISTQEFIDYLNKSGIPQATIKENLDKNIIEELLSGLVSTTLLELEVKDYNISISENTLLKKIKTNKNFLDENGNFQRIKYEKFLLENNQSAPQFELRLKGRELQKNLFDYIGAGSISPSFLVNKLYEEENKKLEIDYINLKNFYKQKEKITEQNLKDFLIENKDQLKVEYVDFDYAVINPKNLIGIDEFNQTFFDKIDQIEIDISNEVNFETIVSDLKIKSVNIKDFKFSAKKNEIEKKIFELRKNNFDIFESGDNYVLYKIGDIKQKEPDLKDSETKKEIVELVNKKNQFDYNKNLLNKINKKEFNNNEFLKMGKDKIESAKLNSVKDNKKFDINAVELLYSLPINSFTLINDDQNNIYIAKVKKFQNESKNNEKFKEYANKQNSNLKNTMLKSYDLFLNDKYNVILNQKTIERVKNFFQ